MASLAGESFQEPLVGMKREYSGVVLPSQISLPSISHNLQIVEVHVFPCAQWAILNLVFRANDIEKFYYLRMVVNQLALAVLALTLCRIL